MSSSGAMEHPAGGRGGAGRPARCRRRMRGSSFEPHRASSDARLFQRYSLSFAGVVESLGGSIEAHEAARLLIPERQAQRREALAEGHNGSAMEHGVLGMASPEVVVRNTRAEMVHVMKADAAGGPFQECRQLEIGASLDRRLCVVPMTMDFPIRTFELMLHEEEPEPGHRREVVRGQIHKEHA